MALSPRPRSSGRPAAWWRGDLILVDLSALNLSPVLDAPVRNIVPNLVYATKAQAQAEALAQRVAADPVHKGMALLEAMEAGRL